MSRALLRAYGITPTVDGRPRHRHRPHPVDLPIATRVQLLADALTAKEPVMQWDLAPGTITPAAIETFTRGACAGLAVALHDATGWPIIEVGHCDELPLHFMVRCPSGLLLDIRGPHSAEAVLDEWELDADGDVSLTEATRADVADCYRVDCGEPVPMDLVRTFVPAVVALAA